MEPDAFDALVRRLRVAGSRRAVGRMLVTLAGSAVLAPPPHAGQAAKRQERARKRRKRGCRGGKTRCGRRCIDTDRDPRHCGRCGNRCQVNGVCEDGRCTCPKGDCSDPGLSCCPEALAVDCTGFSANNPQGRFTELETCGFTTACPADRQCVGPRFQACCPAGSRCDRATGTCLR